MILTSYEERALSEIKKWERARAGFVLKTIDALGKPITIMLENVPKPLRATAERAVMGFMEMLKDLSYWTYSEKSIIKKGRLEGVSVSAVQGLAEQDLEFLDRLAQRHFASGKIIAALEGAGCGMGGLTLIAADIPVLMGIIFRSIQQIGTCYGFPMKDPAMLPVVMGIYHAGSSNSVVAKSAVLADMHIAAAALAGNSAYLKAAATTKTSLVIKFIERSAGSVPSQIASNISKRKMGQLIPVVGAVIGAGFNYWLMSSTITAAYMIFRKLYIERKLTAAESERSDIVPALVPARRRFRLLPIR